MLAEGISNGAATSDQTANSSPIAVARNRSDRRRGAAARISRAAVPSEADKAVLTARPLAPGGVPSGGVAYAVGDVRQRLVAVRGVGRRNDPVPTVRAVLVSGGRRGGRQRAGPGAHQQRGPRHGERGQRHRPAPLTEQPAQQHEQRGLRAAGHDAERLDLLHRSGLRTDRNAGGAAHQVHQQRGEAAPDPGLHDPLGGSAGEHPDERQLSDGGDHEERSVAPPLAEVLRRDLHVDRGGDQGEPRHRRERATAERRAGGAILPRHAAREGMCHRAHRRASAYSAGAGPSWAASARIGSWPPVPTSNWAIMSWSSWTRLWQCIMYLPTWLAKRMTTRTLSDSPTYTTSFGPFS